MARLPPDASGAGRWPTVHAAGDLTSVIGIDPGVGLEQFPACTAENASMRPRLSTSSRATKAARTPARVRRVTGLRSTTLH